jgi:hypothetical protein
MKNSIRIIGVIILTAIYCFVVSTVTNTPISSDYENHQTTEKEQYRAIISNNLFCHTLEVESLSNSFEYFPVPNPKNLFNKHWSTTKFIEQLFESEFTQYYNFSINFLIKYRKSDIIFPFHYFW